MRPTHLLLGLALVLTACTGEPAPTAGPSPTSSGSDVLSLPDGPITPGRYRYVLSDWDTCDPKLGCPGRSSTPLPDVEVTVPEGWEAANEFHVLATTAGNGTEAPDGGSLVIGWTTYWVGLNAEPCLPPGIPGGHQVPDILVGTTVDDFVEAVTAHPKLRATKARDVTLGGHPAKFFSLRTPADVTKCDNWRPWDPGFYAQGPSSTWDVWAVDVNGTRVVVVSDYYAGTDPTVRTQLKEMAESLTFVA